MVFLTILGLLLTVHVPISYHMAPPVTFSHVAGHNPYCIVDPSCLSPLGEGREGLLQGGFVANDFDDMNTLSALALPNYVIFVTWLGAMVYAAERWCSSARARRLAGIVVGTWAWLEVNRWFFQIPVGYGDEFAWIGAHLVVTAGTLGILVATAYLGIHRRRV